MAITEEEAQTKWCPHVIASHTNPRGGFNPGQTVDLRDHVCIGSRCMAWRWRERKLGHDLQYQIDRLGANEGRKAWERFCKEDPLTGFCGLAGPSQ